MDRHPLRSWLRWHSLSGDPLDYRMFGFGGLWQRLRIADDVDAC